MKEKEKRISEDTKVHLPVNNNFVNFLSGNNDYDESTCLRNIVCNISDNDKQNITEILSFWVKINKEICQGKAIIITFSDLSSDVNNLKVKRINTKTEDRVFIEIYLLITTTKKFQYKHRHITMDLVWNSQYIISH